MKDFESRIAYLTVNLWKFDRYICSFVKQSKWGAKAINIHVMNMTRRLRMTMWRGIATRLFRSRIIRDVRLCSTGLAKRIESPTNHCAILMTLPADYNVLSAIFGSPLTRRKVRAAVNTVGWIRRRVKRRSYKYGKHVLACARSPP